MLTILLAISTLLTTWQFRQEPSEQMPNVDTTWHTVQVPHDWAISGPFNRENDMKQHGRPVVAEVCRGWEKATTRHAWR